MTSFDDEKLRQFLKRNEPIAPPAPHNELQLLLAKLGLKKPVRSVSSFPWLAFGGFGAVAAGFVAAVLLAQPPVVEQSSHQAVLDQNFDPEEGDESDFVPTEEVGEEFLGLIATNGVR